MVDEQKLRQLFRPDSITYQLHSFKQLPDSMVNDLGLYKEEFKEINEALKANNNINNQKVQSIKTYWHNWWIYAATFGLLVILLILKFRIKAIDRLITRI